MGNRPRIQRNQMFRAGDIVDGRLPSDGTGQSHKCIVLEDSVINEHTKCIPICNFTGTEPPSSGISVDISEYDLTDLAFVNKKTSSWIFCNMKDCIYGTIQSQHVYGNIKDKYPKLWAKVCQAAYSCPESERLQNVCDCQFEEIKTNINNCVMEPPVCGCS